MQVTVSAVNDSPSIEGLPDVSFAEDSSGDSFDLDDYVSDPDNDDRQLTWAYSGSRKVEVDIDPATHIINFTAPSNWHGQEAITFTTSDPNSSSDTDTINVTVTSENVETINILLEAGWNLISLPLVPQVLYTAENILTEINQQGGDCSLIQKWDGSGWITYELGLPFNKFPIEVGEGCFVYSNINSSWTITGGEASTPFGLNLSRDWNLTGIPIIDAYLYDYKAEGIGEMVNSQGGNCSLVQKWDGSNWVPFQMGTFQGNFDIVAGKGYFILCNQESHWDIALLMVPPALPDLDLVITPTQSNKQTLTGTKETDSSIWLNGKEIVPINSETQWSYEIDLIEGKNPIHLTSKDSAGNQSGAKTETIILDTTLPQLAITFPANGSSVDITPVTIFGTIDDSQTLVEVNGVMATIQGGTFVAKNINLADGVNTIIATAVDQASNSNSDTVTVTLSVNVSPLITDVNLIDDSELLGGSIVTIQAVASDANGDSLEYQFSIEGVVKQSWCSVSTYDWITIPGDQGSYRITVAVRDGKGGTASKEVTYQFSSPTAEDVLQKVADNYGLIEDLKADMTFYSTLDSRAFGDTDYSIYYFKQPIKVKIESYASEQRLTKTDITIINQSTMYLITPTTGDVDEIDLLSDADLTLTQFSQMDVINNLPEFLNNHTVTLNNAYSDLSRGIFTVETIPTTLNNLYSKLEMHIDYHKGLIVKSLLYRDDILVQTSEITSSQKMDNGAWVPVTADKIPVLTAGKFISTATFSNIETNTGLTDEDFNPHNQ